MPGSDAPQATPVKRLTDPVNLGSAQTLIEIIADLKRQLAAGEELLTLTVLDPELGRGHYSGETVDVDGRPRIYRSVRVWLDLADRLGLRLLTPTSRGQGSLELRFEPLRPSPAWPKGTQPSERYGRESGFQRISKLEDPSLLIDFTDALDRIQPVQDARVLALGVNRGDELAILGALRPDLATRGTFVGVDHSESALQLARERFPAPNYSFLTADLNDLHDLQIGTFDLVLAFATLQSPGVDDRALLRHLIKDRLGKRGAFLFGIPNCTYVDGEQLYGAKMKNYRQPDLSLLIKDIAFYRRYLQQHGYQVFITGKYDLLLTAVARAARG